MRQKAASAPVVINNQKLRTASELTQERRLMASSVFPVNGREDGSMRGDLLLTSTAVNQLQPTSFFKQTGKPKNASDFTAFLGSRAIQNDAEVFPLAGKTTVAGACYNTTSTGGKLIAEPVPYITGTTGQIKANTVARSGSDYIRERLACQQSKGEQHIASELGPSVFKDDTISRPHFNKQYLALAARAKAGDTTVKFCDPNSAFPAVEHAHSTTVNRQGWSARPTKSKIPVFNVPSQDYARPVAGSIPNCFTGENTTGVFSRGGILPKDALRYVERKHGNDLLSVNPRKPIAKKYQIPNGTPSQLKINEPNLVKTPNM
jgi:hypothetical protein